VLQALATAFLEFPSAAGVAAGARWWSRVAAVDLHHRRHNLLPLRRAASSSRTPTAAGESLVEPKVEDVDAPLDSNPTATYQFGINK
jgi:hypothetical protein